MDRIKNTWLLLIGLFVIVSFNGSCQINQQNREKNVAMEQINTNTVNTCDSTCYTLKVLRKYDTFFAEWTELNNRTTEDRYEAIECEVYSNDEKIGVVYLVQHWNQVDKRDFPEVGTVFRTEKFKLEQYYAPVEMFNVNFSEIKIIDSTICKGQNNASTMVEITGKALDAKEGATIKAPDGQVFFIEALNYWPDTLINKWLTVKGIIETVATNASKNNTEGLTPQSSPGSKRVIKNATWKPVQNVFENTIYGLVIFFNEPFVAVTGDKSKVFCGPKSDWPFYSGYSFLLEFEKKVSIEAYKEKCEPTKVTGCKTIRFFDVDSKKVLLICENKIEYQCPIYKYIIFGKDYNCTIKYPDCGGIVDDVFREKADQNVRSVVKNMFFVKI